MQMHEMRGRRGEKSGMTNHDKRLLSLMELGRTGNRSEYRREALAWLDRQLGFDGVVWGEGRQHADGVVHILSAELRGRSERILADYGAVAHLDPVARRFARQPRSLQNVVVERDLSAGDTAAVGECLRSHDVGQLMLCGVRSSDTGGLRWLTLYREDRSRPFARAQTEQAAFAIPFVLLAEPDAPPEPAPRITDLLTAREHEVAWAYAEGADYKTIAQQLAVSPATVRTHLQSSFRKLEVHNKIALRARLLG